MAEDNTLRRIWLTRANTARTYQMTIYFIDTPDGETTDREYLTMEIIDTAGRVFFSLPPNLWMLKEDWADWVPDTDILFLTACNRKHFFIYDVEHKWQTSHTLRDNEDMKWNEQDHCFLCTRHEYTIEENTSKRVHYTVRERVELTDPMAGAEDTRVLLTADKTIGVLLRKTKIDNTVWDKDVWQISVFDNKMHCIRIEDFGLYAVNDCVRISEDNHLNFVAVDGKHKYFYTVRFRLTDAGGKTTILGTDHNCTAHVVEFPPITLERFDWVAEDKCYRAVINSAVIRPTRFYFDNMYNWDLKVVNIPLPLAVRLLVEPDNERLRQQQQQEQQKRLDELNRRFEQNNTPAEEIFERAKDHKPEPRRTPKSGGKSAPLPQKYKAGLLLAAATLLVIGLLAGAFIGVAGGGYIGGTATRNLASAIIGVITLWILAIYNFRSARKDSSNEPLMLRHKILIAVIVCALIFLIAGIIALLIWKFGIL